MIIAASLVALGSAGLLILGLAWSLASEAATQRDASPAVGYV